MKLNKKTKLIQLNLFTRLIYGKKVCSTLANSKSIDIYMAVIYLIIVKLLRQMLILTSQALLFNRYKTNNCRKATDYLLFKLIILIFANKRHYLMSPKFKEEKGYVFQNIFQ